MKMARILSLLAWLVVVLIVFVGPCGATDVLESADTFLEQGRFGQAREKYRQVLTADPRNFFALQGVAISSINMGDVSNAVDYFERALNVRSEPELHYNVGRVYIQLGDLDSAFSHFSECSATPSSIQRECHLKLAQLHRDIGNIKEVQLHLHAAIKLDPTRPDAYNYLADTLNNLKQFKMALDMYDKALKYAPGSATLWNSKGDVFTNMKQPFEAAECFKKAMKYSSRKSREYYNAVSGYFFSALELSNWRNWERHNILIQNDLKMYLLHADGQGPPLLSAYRLLFLDIDPQISVGIAKAWSDKLAMQADVVNKNVFDDFQGSTASSHKSHPPSTLKFAYMSRRFEDYPGTQMMVQLFERHNRSRVVVGAMAGGIDDDSVYRAVVKNSSDIFEDYSVLSISEAVDITKRHSFDVIIDYGAKHLCVKLLLLVKHVLCFCRWYARFQFVQDSCCTPRSSPSDLAWVCG